MTKAVVTVGAWEELGQVAETMAKHDLRRVPVVRNTASASGAY